MRRPTATLLVIGLVCAGGGAAQAQEPSPSAEPVGQRVELPGYGFAVSFPSDWTVLEGPEAWPTTTGRRVYTSAIPIFRQLLVADSPVRTGIIEQCEVQSFAYPDLTPIDIAYSLSQTLCLGMSYPSDISLPAGDAARLDCDRGGGGDPRLYQSWYVLAADSGYVWLWCRGPDDASENRWLAIAESLEFLPAEE